MMENKKVSEKKDSWLKVLLGYTEGSGQRLGISVVLSVISIISAASVGPRSSRSLTGPKTARPAPNGCDAVRRPSASGKDTGSTKHKKRRRTQAATWPPRPALCYLLLQTIA